METTIYPRPENARSPLLDNRDRPVRVGHTDCIVGERDHTTLGISFIVSIWLGLGRLSIQ